MSGIRSRRLSLQSHNRGRNQYKHNITWVHEHIHLITGRNVRPLRAKAQLHNVLTTQWLAHVVEIHGFGFLCRVIGIGGRVDGELLIVAECVDSALGEKPCMVNGAVVDDLHEGLVLVCDGGVVDVDESVRAAG